MTHSNLTAALDRVESTGAKIMNIALAIESRLSAMVGKLERTESFTTNGELA